MPPFDFRASPTASARWGDDSLEYKQVGGARKSERKSTQYQHG